jgi:hypothetical protein
MGDRERLSEDGSDTGLLPDADCIELLASNRRRTLLRVLEQDGTRDKYTLESLATAVAQTEREDELGAIPTQRVSTSLHHNHLPKLDDADIVDYDADASRVEYHGDDRIEEWLAAIEQ